MIIDAQITRVDEARSGVAANGLPYCRRTIVIAFAEKASDGNVLNHALTVDLAGEDAQRQYTQFQQVTVEVRFSVSSYKGRVYQDVRGKIMPAQPQGAPSAPMEQQGFFGR